jgi:hypothetical protein
VSRFALRSLEVLGERFHCFGGNVSLFKGLHHNLKTTFKVASKNAGGKTVKKKIKVRK